ncbi:MAG: DUF3500 domain-containing protein, partial [Actinobacteria bacterium]|nr:DUF3500 domain-containing protein [Actinomycetota bacterium]
MKSNYARLVSRTLAISLLAALLAGCGAGEQSSQGEQTTQEESTAATTGESTTAQGSDATSQTVAAAEGFLATLDDAQREQASFDFDDELKSNWTNVPTSDEERNGVSFGDMTEEQRQAAMAILEAGLSEEGYEQTVGTMVADEVLASEGGGGGSQFGIDRYVVGIFGVPSETDPWMLQFAGHHLVLNLTVAGEDNVLTPSFVGVQPSEFELDDVNDLAFEPASVLDGETVRPMGDENDLAFDLMNALDAEQQDQATLDYELSDVVLGPGEDGRVLEPEGIPASEMTADQQTLLLDLVREWVGIVNDEDAAAKM